MLDELKGQLQLLNVYNGGVGEVVDSEASDPIAPNVKSNSGAHITSQVYLISVKIHKRCCLFGHASNTERHPIRSSKYTR